MKRIFVTGISTEVGKTIVSAILVEALKADYWKPVQAGELNFTDAHRVKSLITNERSVIHPSAYELTSPMSPHAAAEIDGVAIELSSIVRPETENHLIIEGAGGLLVPLNNHNTILDLIKPDDLVVVVSRNYLGSINHTLLTLEILRDKGYQLALVFNGEPTPSTEEIITSKSGIPILGHIREEKSFTKEIVKKYALILSASLREL